MTDSWTPPAETRQWTDPAVALHESVKHAFDPTNLLNPGKKRAR